MWQGLPLLWMGKEWSFTAAFLCATICAQNCYKYFHLISSPQNLWKTVIIICIFKDKKPRLRKVSVTCQGHTIGNKVESNFEFMSSTLSPVPFPRSENCALEALTVLLLIHRDTWVTLNIWGEKSNTWHQSDTVRTATLR